VSSSKVYEDDKILAFHDISKAAPIHVLVIPKGEYLDYSDFITKASKSDIAHYFTKINEIALSLGLGENGFRLTTNRGAASGQSVFHFHTHILGGANFGGVV
jgi:diadenosine tetraphosphate (Ap4A) HIT family hydrolase